MDEVMSHLQAATQAMGDLMDALGGGGPGGPPGGGPGGPDDGSGGPPN